MSQLTKAQLDTTYTDVAGTFADNTSGGISAGDMRQFSDDLADSMFTVSDHPNLSALSTYMYRAAVTVSSAELLAMGATPKTIVAAPGANKYISVVRISASYNYGATPYDYASTESPTFIIGAGNGVGQIVYTTMNESNDFNVILQISYFANSQKVTTNTALTLTTADAGEATTGDGDLDVVVYYTIENVNI